MYTSITIEYWDDVIGTWMTFDDVEYDSVASAKDAIFVAMASYDYRFRIYKEQIIEVTTSNS